MMPPKRTANPTARRSYTFSAMCPSPLALFRFIRAIGATAYGYGLFSERISYDDYGAMFHGNDERVDQESLRLSTELWEAVAHDLLTEAGRGGSRAQ